MRPPVHEALGMRGIRRREHMLALGAHCGGLAEVDDGRREKAEATVMMCLVVPGEERLAERPPIFDRSEAVGKLRTVFQRSEVRFGKRVVVGDLRPTVRLDDAQIRQQPRDGFTAHRAAAVGMAGRQLAWCDPVLGARLGDEPLGERGAFVRRDHPADHIAAEDVEDHIEIEVWDSE